MPSETEEVDSVDARNLCCTFFFHPAEAGDRVDHASVDRLGWFDGKDNHYFEDHELDTVEVHFRGKALPAELWLQGSQAEGPPVYNLDTFKYSPPDGGTKWYAQDFAEALADVEKRTRTPELNRYNEFKTRDRFYEGLYCKAAADGTNVYSAIFGT